MALAIETLNKLLAQAHDFDYPFLIAQPRQTIKALYQHYFNKRSPDKVQKE